MQLKQVRLILSKYLEQESGIGWEYFDSSLPAKAEDKAGIKVSRILPFEEDKIYANELVRKRFVFFQCRVLISDSLSEQSTDIRLLEWQDKIEDILHKLSWKGIEIGFEENNILNLLQGIDLTEKGYQFIVEETLSAQTRNQEKLWKGSLWFELKWLYEADFTKIMAQFN